MRNKVLLNLLNYPPSEGSRESHQAWKENVRMMGFHSYIVTPDAQSLWEEIMKPGYVTKTCRDAAMAYAKSLTP